VIRQLKSDHDLDDQFHDRVPDYNLLTRTGRVAPEAPSDRNNEHALLDAKLVNRYLPSLQNPWPSLKESERWILVKLKAILKY